MKKGILVSFILVFALSLKSFASAGYANDELEFLIVIVGVLLIVAVILDLKDIYKKNGRSIILKGLRALKKKIILLLGTEYYYE